MLGLRQAPPLLAETRFITAQSNGYIIQTISLKFSSSHDKTKKETGDVRPWVRAPAPQARNKDQKQVGLGMAQWWSDCLACRMEGGR
jgi:hypothetical protein